MPAMGFTIKPTFFFMMTRFLYDFRCFFRYARHVMAHFCGSFS